MVGWRWIREDILDIILTFKTPEEITNTIKKDELTFKADPTSGEGQATADELRYRQDLLDLLNRLYKAVNKIEDSKISDEDKNRKQEMMVNDFIRQGQDLSKTFINEMYGQGVELATQKLAKIDIKAKEPKIPPEQLTKLMAWQEFAIKKIGITILLNLQNTRYKKDYFGEAYG